MESDTSKVCIICCHSFIISDQIQNKEIISKLCKEIKRSSSTNFVLVDVLGNEVNFCEKLKKLEGNFGLTICPECLTDLNKVRKSNEKMSSQEKHVNNLQLQILKGLRELEECQKIIKCCQEKIRLTLDKSNVSRLEKRFHSDVDPISGDDEHRSNFIFKLRQSIIQDALHLKDRKLNGNLTIPPTENNRRQTVVKVEVEPEVDQEDDDCNHFDSYPFLESDIPAHQLIKTDLQQSSNQRQRKPRMKYEERDRSSMTLRKRISPKLKDEIRPSIITPPQPTFSTKPPTKLKRKRKPRPAPPKKITKPPRKLHRPTSTRTSSSTNPYRKLTIHSCQLCPFKTRRIPSFEQHLKEHETPIPPSIPLQCSHCPSQFSTPQYLQFHKTLHQQDIHTMCCDICSKLFPILSLPHHISTHFNLIPLDTTIATTPPTPTPPPKIISCQNCSYCCTTPQAYLTHQRSHYISETSKFPCINCSEIFDTPIKLVRHFPQAHYDTPEVWPCDFENCSKIFISKDLLYNHKRYRHKIKSKILPCRDPNCGKMFSSIKSMEIHFYIHSGVKPFPCEICGERYLQREALRFHRRREHGAAKLKCRLCGKEFIQPKSLKSHMALHENRGVACEICGMIFGSKNILENHRNTHSEETRWTCERCGKGFKSQGGWKDHMAVHENKKNLSCEYCGKGFVRKNNLRDHLRVHTGERPFICDVCGKDFNQASAMKIHKKNQHQ